MKKILSSLMCFGAISTFASANMVNVDLMYSTTKLPSGLDVKLDDDSVLKWNIKAQKYKNSNEDTPFIGAFRLGGRTMYSYVLAQEGMIGELARDIIDFDLLGGYGFYIDEGSAKTKVNLLVGLNYIKYDERIEDEGDIDKFRVATNALKVGVSTFTSLNNGIVASVDAYIKHYLDDKRKKILHNGEKLDSDTKFEVDGMIGYKFGKENEGFMLGLKGGYHNDLIGKGGHFGLSLGYVF